MLGGDKVNRKHVMEQLMRDCRFSMNMQLADESYTSVGSGGGCNMLQP